MTASRSLPLRTTHALPLARTMLFGRPPTESAFIGGRRAGVVVAVLGGVLVVPLVPLSPPPRAKAAIAASATTGTAASAHSHSRRPDRAPLASTVGAWSG